MTKESGELDRVLGILGSVGQNDSLHGKFLQLILASHLREYGLAWWQGAERAYSDFMSASARRDFERAEWPKMYERNRSRVLEISKTIIREGGLVMLGAAPLTSENITCSNCGAKTAVDKIISARIAVINASDDDLENSEWREWLKRDLLRPEVSTDIFCNGRKCHMMLGHARIVPLNRS